ncbi:AraC family transcriptional regulator [Paenibacillus humicola]|uniref:AraC family transcriptional regulator n=1 Tax=Paenibacillus humicola TaxID=3110540 RepID=UPI00237AFA1A|nr:AraC family transcriptional regulator [Paenibacillus humicola]
MKLTGRMILHNQFRHFQADVFMAALSAPGPHWQADSVADYNRFWLFKRGTGLLTVNGQTHEVAPGQLYLLPRGASVSYGNGGEPDCELYWCHFRAPVGDMRMFDLLQLPAGVTPSAASDAEGLFDKLLRAYRSERFTKELRQRAALLDIVACYLECCDLSDEKLHAIEALETLNPVLEYIEDHLQENIGVDKLARLAYLHPNYFIGFFKHVVGSSPIQYVNGRRLERAKRLLEETGASMSDVAREVGLQSHYLSRMFKQHTGLTPSRYRQIYQHAHGESSVAGEGCDEEL